MQNKKLIILGILSIIAIFSLTYGIVTPPRRRQEILSKPIEEKTLIKVRITPTPRQAQRTGYSTWGRNPFAPKIHVEPEVPKFTLNGILWDEKTPKAIINDTIVGIGDKINGRTIIEIREDSVILNDGTVDFELTLYR
jgi:hypothetical protein